MTPAIPTNFASAWEDIAREHPDRDCQVQGDRHVTWGQTNARANAIAQTLLEAGLVHQDKVALYLYNCPEYLEAAWASFKAGLVPVNTNYRYRGDELIYLWTNAEVRVVIFHTRFASVIEEIRDRLRDVALWLCVDDGSGPTPEWADAYTAAAQSPPPEDVLAPWGRGDDDIYLLYTGGTTGLPKGVMWRQADIFRYFDSVTPAPTDSNAPPPPPPIHLVSCPFMHGTGFVTSLRALSSGGVIVSLPSISFDVEELLDAVERERVTTLAIVGDTFAKPMLRALDAQPDRWDISSLKLVTSSGVMWSSTTKEGLLRHNATMVLFDSLGSAEAMGLGSSLTTAKGSSKTAKFQISNNTRVVSDDDRFVEPGSGEVGQLAVRGVMPVGYYKDAQKTLATFRVIEGDRWSIPGDFATVEADGTVTFLGRGSSCINTGGEKVFPEEVEEVLKLHPSIADAVVIGLPDERFGERIHAIVEMWPGFEPDEVALIEHVKAKLAGYKAPRVVVAVPSIDRAANGKVDYNRWRDYAQQNVK